jgi:hypothetical protein
MSEKKNGTPERGRRAIRKGRRDGPDYRP